MEFKFKKHVRIICDLEIGDKVMTDRWGPKLDGIVHTILDIKPEFGGCESGILVKIDGYDGWIDTGWLNKLNPSNT